MASNNVDPIMELLDLIEDILEQSSTIPFSSKVMVNKEEILDIITDIRLKIPNEIKQSKWVIEERNKILIDAQKEADAIVKEGGMAVNKMVDEHEVTRLAKANAEKIIEEAKYTAREMRLGAIEYADEILAVVQKNLETALSEANKGSEESLKNLEKVFELSKDNIYQQAEKNQEFYVNTLETIYKNRQELRGGNSGSSNSGDDK